MRKKDISMNAMFELINRLKIFESLENCYQQKSYILMKYKGVKCVYQVDIFCFQDLKTGNWRQE